MKIRSLFLGFCFSLCASAFAANQHMHPQSAAEPLNAQTKSALPKDAKWPGYCEIEIINNSFDDVRVYGVFDDGASLEPFNVYSFGAAQYISLYYYGYCHAGMDLYIDTFSGYHVYAGYTTRRSTIRVVPYLGNQLKAEIQAK